MNRDTVISVLYIPVAYSGVASRLVIIPIPGVQKCGRALAGRDQKLNYFEAG